MIVNLGSEPAFSIPDLFINAESLERNPVVVRLVHVSLIEVLPKEEANIYADRPFQPQRSIVTMANGATVVVRGDFSQMAADQLASGLRITGGQHADI